MKKLILAGCAVLIGVAVAGCSSASDQLVASIEAADAQSVSLADVYDSTADSYLFLCPYESRYAMEDRLGFAWPDAPDYSMQDHKQGIALVTGKEVDLIELSLSEVDLCTSEDPLTPMSQTLEFTQGSDRWVLSSN